MDTRESCLEGCRGTVDERRTVAPEGIALARWGVTIEMGQVDKRRDSIGTTRGATGLAREKKRFFELSSLLTGAVDGGDGVYWIRSVSNGGKVD
jgi:hypothetical protein